MLCWLLKLNIKFLEWRGKKLKKLCLSLHCLLVLKVVYPNNDSKKERCYKQKALYYITAVVQEMFSVFTAHNLNTLHCDSHQRGNYYIQNALEVAFDHLVFSINTCNVCIYVSMPFAFNKKCQKELHFIIIYSLITQALLEIKIYYYKLQSLS